MVLLFALTLFVGSTLLFLIEPMFAKMVLPLLGGTPAVWNTCMVFFQVALLAGYTYAHFSASRLSSRKQIPVHAVMVLLPLAFLPIHIATNLVPPTESNPVPWLLLILAMSAGIPFFVVSSTAPMIQRWFAHIGHQESKDPYFLYAASNLGSIVGLLGYLVVFEPHFTLAQQSRIWTAGYVLLIALTVGCASAVLKSRKASGEGEISADASASSGVAPSEKIAFVRKLRWIALAFVPSSLMLGVTTHLTTDIASVPLLWVIPLTLYLLTFIIAFSRRSAVPVAVAVWLMPVMIVVNALVWGFIMPMPWQPLIHLITFFATALACHGLLADDRPSPAHLTEYYMLMSVGGAIGGLFNGLLAPVIFTSVAEYPIALILGYALIQWPYTGLSAPDHTKALGRVTIRILGTVCLLAAGIYAAHFLPAFTGTAGWRVAGVPVVSVLLGVLYVTLAVVYVSGVWKLADGKFRFSPPTDMGALQRSLSLAWPLAVGLLAVLAASVNRVNYQYLEVAKVAFALAAATTYVLIRRPVRFELGLAAILFAVWAMGQMGRLELHQERSFFGVLRVIDSPNDKTHTFMHGTTLHGMQIMTPALQAKPITYYAPTGPIGQTVQMVSERTRPARVGVLGLGAGALASYSRKGDSYTFFEIDPAVREMASNPQYFTYLRDARSRGVNLNIVMGDARLTIKNSPDNQLDMLLMDAFSSDSIPTHLLTKEAIEAYLPKMAPHGIIGIHISNRYLDLKQTIANVAGSLGLACMGRNDMNETLTDGERAIHKFPSKLVILARNESDFGSLRTQAGWAKLTPEPNQRVWTDDYSNILDVIMWRRPR